MKKEVWIEKLRALAAVAVVLIHVVQGTFVNGTEGVPLYRCLFDTSLLMSITAWAVPVFVMISGYLLLNPEKDLPVKKVKKYIGKILLILVTLGLGFCLIESFLSYRSKGLWIVVKDAVVNLISGRSWAHMWYLYMLLGLYVLTPVLRAFVKEATEETARFVMVSLFVLTIVVPTVNRIFGSSVTNFYLSPFPYVFYYLFGHYVTKLRISERSGYITGGIAFTVCVLLSALDIQAKHWIFDYDNVFLALLSMCIFFVAYQKKERPIRNERLAKMVHYVSGASFCIYLLHPLFLNVLNKGLGVMVTRFPVVLGELLFFGIAFSLSLFSYAITKRIFH